MVKPKKPQRPKPVIVLTEEEKKQQEFQKKVAEIQRRQNEALNTPEFLKFANEVINQRK